MPHYTTCDGNIKYRNSKDLVCTPRGKDLIDSCVASNLYILNGRTFGDLFGKYTCIQYNGNSVTDYCIVSESMFRKVLYFHVHDFKPLLSDHAIITTKLYINYIPENEISKSRRINMPLPCVWNTESQFIFSNALGYSCVKDKISSFLK